jgi:quercetin dioxygenase-like cupin family protein
VKYVRRDPSARKPNTEAVFEGDVRNQMLSQNDQYRVNEVEFSNGGRTKWHTHTFHQVLVITEGEGIVASEDEERRVTVGDVLHVEPGTRHWHGTEAGQKMTHLSVNGPGDTSL